VITKEQLSNLKALADCIGAKHTKSYGKMVVEITEAELEAYFCKGDEEDNEEDEQVS
jgi:hypothetical protein